MAITGTTDFGNGVLLVTVDHDPAAVATDAPEGSLVIQAGTCCIYRKLDSGSSSNVMIMGGVTRIETISAASTTIGDVDGKQHILVDAGANNCLFNLPTASDNNRRTLIFTIIDTNNGEFTVTVKPEGAETLNQYTNGSPWTTTTQWDSITAQCNGTNWFMR